MWKRAVIAVLSASAAAAALASITPFVAGWLWLGELASHFRVQYLAASVGLAIALVLVGRARRAALLLPVAALNAYAIAPVLLPEARAVPDGARLKLIVANLAAHNTQVERFVEIVARERPDVVVLAEYTHRAADALRPLEAELPHTQRVARSDTWGIALMSRLPIERSAVFDLGPTPVVDAALRGPRGPVRVLGVHLVPPTTAERFATRNAQLASLAELAVAEDGPLVISGDFNLSPYSPYFARWLEDSGLNDTLAGRGLDFTWPSGFPVLGIPIDHTFVSTDFSVQERRRLERFGSDHLPVLVDLIQDETKHD